MTDEHVRRLIASSVAEVDPSQMAITRRLTPAQRVAQALSMIKVAERVAVYRLMKRSPSLSGHEARHTVREGQSRYGPF